MSKQQGSTSTCKAFSTTSQYESGSYEDTVPSYLLTGASQTNAAIQQPTDPEVQPHTNVDVQQQIDTAAEQRMNTAVQQPTDTDQHMNTEVQQSTDTDQRMNTEVQQPTDTEVQEHITAEDSDPSSLVKVGGYGTEGCCVDIEGQLYCLNLADIHPGNDSVS